MHRLVKDLRLAQLAAGLKAAIQAIATLYQAAGNDKLAADLTLRVLARIERRLEGSWEPPRVAAFAVRYTVDYN